MATAEQINKLHELRNSVEALTQDFNAEMQEEHIRVAKEVEKKIVEAVNEYTATAREICFSECAAADDPMIEAVKRLSFMTIGVRDEKVEDSDLTIRRVIEKDKPIDLLKLNKYCAKINGKGIGANENWPYMIEKFNLLLTARTAEDLGIDPTHISDSYAMSEIAREIDLGKNPVSKTKILDTLRGILSAMVGEEYGRTAISHDVAFLLKVYSKKGRQALCVNCANHKYLRGYLMEVCHHIVTGEPYTVDYKKVK